MILHGFWRSSATYRVRIALALKGLACEYRPVNIGVDHAAQFSTPYQALNPESRVPTLEVDGLVLTQSWAILEWLEERHPIPPLLPGSPDERARVRGLAQLVVADIQPLQNLGVTEYLKQPLGASPEAVAAWLQHWIARGLAAFEARLARDAGTGRFCHGETPTLADVCLVPQCYSARRFGVDPAAYPQIARIEANCQALPAFAAAVPERQPDAIR
ncbi:MAG: maleylacetoacetate isomerase [Gammaproteobacteria bacterium]